MILCRYDHAGTASFGLVESGSVTRIEGDPFGAWRKTGESVALASAKLLVPIMPGTFYAIGSNYERHVVERAKVRGKPPKFYDEPRVGYRANSALVPTGANIVKPKGSGPTFQYEAELVAVVGRTMRNVSAEEARAGIFGWTIGNDVTERAWQRDDPTNLRGKNADTFKPMGPWIATDVSPDDMTTKVSLNKKVVHEFRTGAMLFDAGAVIASIARTNTLHPGDVVWLGTDELPLDMKAGDQIDIEISGIGTLSNTVVDE